MSDRDVIHRLEKERDNAYAARAEAEETNAFLNKEVEAMRADLYYRQSRLNASNARAMRYEAEARKGRQNASMWQSVAIGAACVVMAIGVLSATKVAGLNDKVSALEAEAAKLPKVQIVEVEPTPVYYDVPLSHFKQDILRVVADRYDLDMRIPLAIMQKETGFDQFALGDNGNSYGVMQIQPKWHSKRMLDNGAASLYSFFDNAVVGCDYIAELLETHPLANALACYNSGDPALPNQYAEDVMSIMDAMEVE